MSVPRRRTTASTRRSIRSRRVLAHASRQPIPQLIAGVRWLGNGMEPTALWLPFNEKRRLHHRAYRAQQRDQSEVCGAVVANRNGLCALHFLPNRSTRPASFTIQQSDIRAIREQLRQSQSTLVAIFHSHPMSDAIPGEGDIARTPLKYLQLIYDVCGRTLRMWKVRRVGRQRVASEVSSTLKPRISPRRLTMRSARRARRQASDGDHSRPARF